MILCNNYLLAVGQLTNKNIYVILTFGVLFNWNKHQRRVFLQICEKPVNVITVRTTHFLLPSLNDELDSVTIPFPQMRKQINSSIIFVMKGTYLPFSTSLSTYDSNEI